MPLGTEHGKGQNPDQEDASGSPGTVSGRRGSPGSREPQTSVNGKMQTSRGSSPPRVRRAGVSLRLKKKASQFRERERSLNRLRAQVWDGGTAGTGARNATGQWRRGRSLTSGGYLPEALPTAPSQPAGAWPSESWRKGAACPLALGRGAARRGGPRKSRSGARAPQRPAEAERGAARREPGKDAPGGVGGVGERGGEAEPAESRAAPDSGHPRSRLRSPRTSAEKAGPSRPRAPREGWCGGALWANGATVRRRFSSSSFPAASAELAGRVFQYV